MKNEILEIGDQFNAEIAQIEEFGGKYSNFKNSFLEVEDITVNGHDENEYKCKDEEGNRMYFSDSKLKNGGIIIASKKANIKTSMKKMGNG